MVKQKRYFVINVSVVYDGYSNENIALIDAGNEQRAERTARRIAKNFFMHEGEYEEIDNVYVKEATPEEAVVLAMFITDLRSRK